MAGQCGATKLDLVKGNRYRVRWHGETGFFYGVFVCSERGFYIFISDDGTTMVCRHGSVVIME